MKEKHTSNVIYLEGITPLEELLSQGLGAYGFRFFRAVDTEELLRLLYSETVDALLVDLDLADGQPSQVRLDELRRCRPFTVPMIALSHGWNVELRLQAVQAGCNALFPKPPDFPELAESLEHLTHPVTPAPHRILVVEDSPTQAYYLRRILESGGMVVELVTEPLKVFDALALFQPDLILMDLYMPGCDGPDLAALIRMGRAYLDLPIVYLSSETDQAKQLSAMRKGADDFLTKGIAPEFLLSSVRIRAERTRLLRSLARQDSLTGLLNHSSLKGRLAEEVLRTERSGSHLCFAMLDIDHFKAVNDSYGHATGDMVIQALAFLLKRRLRRTDIVGRYGGEEFGIILPETSLGDAFQVINGVREAFAGLGFMAADKPFHVTFSAGIASLDSSMTADALCETADAMLYVGKRSGRNRVEPRMQSS
ncbi:diguanylate cyclase [Holophaga foetida]|uniref:diguanylate cyclase n=1 Tax=Holophaga foetida TaxID=35839 RepID=UPI000247538F|nr:diguanylate cyclase [Holophaga foetida]